MKFFCIADPDSIHGFQLTGIECHSVITENEARHALELALQKKDMGIIIITEKVAQFIREDIEDLTYNQQLPLIVEIPSRGMTSSRKSVNDFLKEAIGISL